MLSPDHQWVWDGTEWKPVSDPSNPTHKAVFAAWNAATAGVPVVASTAQPMQPRARAVAAAVPLGVAARPETYVPLWRRSRATGVNKYLYIGAAGVGVLIAIVLFNTFVLSNVDLSSISLPGSSAAPSKQASQPPPVLLPARSEAGRAGRLINGILTPSVASINAALVPVTQVCNGTLTLSCGSAMAPAARQVKQVLSVLAQESVPSCVTTQVGRVKLDISNLDTTLSQMKHSYDTNQAKVFTQYLARLNSAGRPLQVDLAAAAKAQPACDATVYGP
jgi:hypothetical protein